MVAKITVSSGIQKSLNYNEHKVAQNKADCIYSHLFLKDTAQLNFYDKLNRFTNLIALNTRAKTNNIHISLNFSPDENIIKEKMIEIAKTYMLKIGFNEQPYLVYQHHDAGHPHIHIVSTNITSTGNRISLHNLGRNQSNTARKEIESIYGLIKAEKQHSQRNTTDLNIYTKRLIYGKALTKQTISNIVNAVILQYAFSSLAEFNALLKEYNIIADRGLETSMMYKMHGLVYRALDDNGNKIGVPIKASSLTRKPTLKMLENKFLENSSIKHNKITQLKTMLDWILLSQPKNLESFQKALAKQNINLSVRRNDAGYIYGLTYIDHNSKCVFNGSSLGKKYSAKTIQDLFKQKQNVDIKIEQQNSMGSDQQKPYKTPSDVFHKNSDNILFDVVAKPEIEFSNIPFDLLKRRKKRRKIK